MKTTEQMIKQDTLWQTSHQRFTCLLNADEANQCRYALNELANKRQEQALDWERPHLNEEAQSLRELATRIAKHCRL